MGTVTTLATYRTAPGRLRDLLWCTAALDRTAFAQLYDAMLPAVTATVNELTDDPVRAHAITTAAFARVWRDANANAAVPSDVKAWVMEIVVGLAAQPACPAAESGAVLAALLNRGPPAGRRVLQIPRRSQR